MRLSPANTSCSPEPLASSLAPTGDGELFFSLPKDILACVVATMPPATMRAFAQTCRAAAETVRSEAHWHQRFAVRLCSLSVRFHSP